MAGFFLALLKETDVKIDNKSYGYLLAMINCIGRETSHRIWKLHIINE